MYVVKESDNMTCLDRTINRKMEREFDIRTTDFFRPALKQIGNSLHDIKTSLMSDKVTTIPQNCTPVLAEIKDKLLSHLDLNSVLFQQNIATASRMRECGKPRERPSTFLVMMDSLALAMDFVVSPRPSNAQCDVLLAICGQPVIVLTVVKDTQSSDALNQYNTSVARGITMSMRKYMDEGINVVFGVLHPEDLSNRSSFEEALKKHAKRSSMFVTRCTMETDFSKYNKIVTAIWAAMAETKSVISGEGEDTDCIRFLTKEQCSALIENINRKRVLVKFKPGSGAKTLMLETARRLAKLDDTLLVCTSTEEKVELSIVYPKTEVVTDVNPMDYPNVANVLVQQGTLQGQIPGKLWSFTKDYAEIEDYQQSIEALEKKCSTTQIRVANVTNDDLEKKLSYLLKEMPNLKLLDIIYDRQLHTPSDNGSKGDHASLYAISNTESDFNVLKGVLTMGGFRSRKTFSQILEEQGDLPQLIDLESIKMKRKICYLRTKKAYLRKVTHQKTKLDKNDHESHVGCKSQKDQSDGKSENTTITEKKKDHSYDIQDQLKQDLIKTETEYQQKAEQAIQENLRKRRDSNNEGVLKWRVLTDSELKNELKRRRDELEEEMITTEKTLQRARLNVEREAILDGVSLSLSALKHRKYITHWTGTDNIPESTVKISGSTYSRHKRRPQEFFTRLQHGKLKEKDFIEAFEKILKADRKKLLKLQMDTSRLQKDFGCPVYIVGDISCRSPEAIACYPMTLNKNLVRHDLCVSDNGLQLTNTDESGKSSEKFTWFRGTVSSPITPVIGDLTEPSRYWEGHTTIRQKTTLPTFMWTILQIGVSAHSDVDSGYWIANKEKSWAVTVDVCDTHRSVVCTQVWGWGKKKGYCRTQTLTNQPGVESVLRYGVLLDTFGGRLAFFDLDRELVLQTFNCDFDTYLYPMFYVTPGRDKCEVTMKLISGSDVTMNDAKRELIQKALNFK